MTRIDLHDVMRRAIKLLDECTTDMALQEHREPASSYTSEERFALEHRLVRESPQLVGYASELPPGGSFVTKEVMGLPLLLTRARDGKVRAFHNICQHRQAPVANGCGVARRLACPYHSWTYDLDGTVVGVPGPEGFTEARSQGLRLTELPAAEFAGFLWVGLEPDRELDVAAHLGDLADELAGWDIGSWAPVGEKRLDVEIDWKLALDTFAENYHFATVHTTTFATVAHSNCTVFDRFGAHHRLVFPLRGIEDCAAQPESDWAPMQKLVVIYALYPNIVLSVTAVNGEIFRVYPGAGPGTSTTFHQNASALELTDEATRRGAEEIFDYAHHTVRDEDYLLAAAVQANMATGLQPTVLFGRNEPGVHHRHEVLAAELREARTGEPLSDTRTDSVEPPSQKGRMHLMTVLKTGSRLKSQVDDTELIVIKAPAGDVDLLIGGHPVIDVGAEAAAGLSLDPDHSGGSLLGKRYGRAADDLELLVTKGGAGSMSIDGETLEPKESKPLPSSD